jgi:hypothetical protein
LAVRLTPRRQLLFSDRHTVFGIDSALTAVGKGRPRLIRSPSYDCRATNARRPRCAGDLSPISRMACPRIIPPSNAKIENLERGAAWRACEVGVNAASCPPPGYTNGTLARTARKIRT